MLLKRIKKGYQSTRKFYKTNISTPYSKFQSRGTIGERVARITKKPKYKKIKSRARQIGGNIDNYFQQSNQELFEIGRNSQFRIT